VWGPSLLCSSREGGGGEGERGHARLPCQGENKAVQMESCSRAGRGKEIIGLFLIIGCVERSREKKERKSGKGRSNGERKRRGGTLTSVQAWGRRVGERRWPSFMGGQNISETTTTLLLKIRN